MTDRGLIRDATKIYAEQNHSRTVLFDKQVKVAGSIIVGDGDITIKEFKTDGQQTGVLYTDSNGRLTLLPYPPNDDTTYILATSGSGNFVWVKQETILEGGYE